jgi:hypothetical protein
MDIGTMHRAEIDRALCVTAWQFVKQLPVSD